MIFHKQKIEPKIKITFLNAFANPSLPRRNERIVSIDILAHYAFKFIFDSVILI